MNENRERDLDRALGSGGHPSDQELAALLDQAELVKSELHAISPTAARERTLFVQGVAARSSSPSASRFLAPAAFVAGVLIAVAGFGRNAVPGQTLYPVRQALASVGLASSPTEEIERRIADAREQLAEASSLTGSDPSSAQSHVFEAVFDLRRARDFLRDVPTVEQGGYLASIVRLEDRAAGMIADLERAEKSDAELRGNDEENSGPGSGSDDSSGPGSGSEDNSGPGSGDEGGGGDDSSGPGSGDDGGGGDDSSGPGGGDDKSGSGGGDDSSGPDGGDDGSSGSGSGGETDGPEVKEPPEDIELPEDQEPED
ncbi:MAG TPA: hypothetical protein VEV82_05975 [Actinomycetota bacterium]|nr:hypothetical protein [Actinomycetota bacterium]